MRPSITRRSLATAALIALLGIFAFNDWAPLAATYDYVVVGGGTAGITIGARLAQHGYRIAVVEAGGYYEVKRPITRIPGAAILGLGASIQTASVVDWRFVVRGQAGTDYRDIHYPRGKCVGGSPSVGAMRKWAQVVDDPTYLFENTLPFFQRTVTFTPPSLRPGNIQTQYNQSAFSETGQPLHVSYPIYPMPFSTWAQEGFSQLGIMETQDFNSGSLMGHQFCAMTIRPTDQSRSSAEAAFLQLSQNLQNLTIYQKTLAQRIQFNKKKQAVGVRVKQWFHFTLKARREVIISAGAFQSPQLLMVSGIGPRDILQRYGIKVIADRGGVGQNMWDHVFFGPSYPVSVKTYSALAQSPLKLAFHTMEYLFFKRGILTNPSTDYLAFENIPLHLRSNLSTRNKEELAWFPEDWPQYLVASAYVGNFSDPFVQQPSTGQYGTIVGSLVAPTSRGNVTIQSADLGDPPIINPNWLASETDQRIAVAIYRRIREIFNTSTMASIITGPEYFPGPEYQTDAEILDVIRKTMMTIYHAAGTCKMGLWNDTMAVVDNKARVFGVSGLRVVDASAFPILPPGHPQSTVYMLAEKIAAGIIEP
ncbi:Dehydrogenase patE [Penicillium hispanicum]|uniref:Dehydrogenase patE n=1 Tax=Penicillium hispanicum TaxID=1080232 RepID=UPI0025412778|nr:Dehydrogenase patE [Penicillium hispanicum]KAJ5592013.1 Dehydrogenase patE [Penicillium hispanicum]